jgi:transcriptional regulator with XRE-family HTH domain
LEAQNLMAKRASQVDKHVGNNVRARRVALNLSQTALGTALGVTFQQIQKYERGSNRISASKLHKIAEVLHVKPEYFFYGLDPVLGKVADPMRELRSHRDALALVRAFQRISNSKLRRTIVALIEELVLASEL